jgi:hypothetical protein
MQRCLVESDVAFLDGVAFPRPAQDFVTQFKITLDVLAMSEVSDGDTMYLVLRKAEHLGKLSIGSLDYAVAVDDRNADGRMRKACSSSRMSDLPLTGCCEDKLSMCLY